MVETCKNLDKGIQPSAQQFATPNGYMNSMEPFDYDDEIDLLELFGTIWEKKIPIFVIVFFSVLVTVVVAVKKPNIYSAKAVIMPISPQGGRRNAGGLLGMAAQFSGISLSRNVSLEEVKILLASESFKQKIIEEYDLLPQLFPQAWDSESKTWKAKKRDSSNLILKRLDPRVLLSRIVQKIHPPPHTLSNKALDGSPDIRMGIRKFRGMLNVDSGKKRSFSLTITIENRDPQFAVDLVNHTLVYLKESMRNDALNRARNNRAYLVGQLETASDPIIKNKIYDLIAAEVEKETMAGNVDNYAFKVVDPPMVPDRKIRPNRGMMVALGAGVGLFLGVFGVLFVEYAKKTRQDKTKKV